MKLKLLKRKHASSECSNPVFEDKNLKDFSHVFVRYEGFRGSLQPLPDESYPVLSLKDCKH